MDNTFILITIVVLLIVGAIAAWIFVQKQRTKQLRERFGSEYEHLVSEVGDRRQAETELEARQKRVETLDIRSLSPEERKEFAEAWQSIQARFVDEPAATIMEADQLVTKVMQARGYSVADFEQRVADISVDHPTVVMNYRTAREIARKNERQEANTEDLRQALVHYRALFEELLETREVERKERV